MSNNPRFVGGVALRFLASLVVLCALPVSLLWAQAGGRNMGPPPGPRVTNQQRFLNRLHEEGGPAFRPTNEVSVADVRVVGNETVPTNRVFTHLRTRKGRTFDPVVVEADVRRLVSSGLFQDVRTFTSDSPQGRIVTFQVFERPTIRYIRYVGNRGLGERALARESGLKEGDALNVYAVEEARRKIEELYQRRGFPKTKVSIFEGNKPRDRGVVLVIGEAKLQRIASVSIVGNDPQLATAARLKTQIKSKPGILWYFGGRVDRAKIDEDVQRLTAYYRSLGYFRARISRELEFDKSNKWLDLTFVIDEGPRYRIRNVSIVGNQKFDMTKLLGRLSLKSEDFFNADRMSRDVNQLRDLYGSRGHIYANVEADPRFLEEPGWLDLVYKVEEGEMFRVGSIHVHVAGEYPHTRKSVVLNRLSFRPGDVVDIRHVRDSERRLGASQLFETDPRQGGGPRIVVRPPELTDLDGTSGRKIRSQSPDNGPRPSRHPAPGFSPSRALQPWSTPVPRGTNYPWRR